MKRTIRCEACGRIRKKQHEAKSSCPPRVRHTKRSADVYTRRIRRELWKMSQGLGGRITFKEFMRLEG